MRRRGSNGTQEKNEERHRVQIQHNTSVGGSRGGHRLWWLSASAPDASAQQRDILIGGGSVTGVYYQVALQTCQIMNKHSGGKYNCVGRPALGSVFNINAVNRGLLDFGVAQSDRNW